MTDNLLVLAGGPDFLSLDMGEAPPLLLTQPLAPVLAVAVQPTKVLSAPAGQGPAGPPGQNGASNDLVFTAPVALSGHMAVCIGADGTLAYASADTPASAESFLGITLGAAAPGAPIAVRFTGVIVEPSWAWTSGLPVYVGLGGALTQADPATGYALAVGVATAPDALLVAPHPPILIA